MLLLDTNTVIYFFKGMGRVPERLVATPPGSMAVSAITVFELLVGIGKSARPKRRRSQLSTLLSLISILPFGEREAEVAAAVRASLEKSGTPIGPLDNLIAGTACAHNATLVTRNVAEFRRVRDLRVENWF